MSRRSEAILRMHDLMDKAEQAISSAKTIGIRDHIIIRDDINHKALNQLLDTVDDILFDLEMMDEGEIE